MATWYSLDDDEQQTRLLAAWADAPIENEELASRLLAIAADQVVAYGPAEGDDEDFTADPPENYVQAQLMLAQQVWNDARPGSGDTQGADGFTFTPAALTKKIRQIIRPVDGKPHVL